jgi:uncharacterized protein YecE (DUF72 family)
LTEYFVGAGGWAYFPVKVKPKLKAYAEVFNFVEVNSTFYEYPDPNVVEKWRRTVPPDFTFSVRCHQDLTHRIGLKPTNEAYHVLGQMLAYCGILRAPWLVLETPASYVLNDETVDEASAFLASANLHGVKLAWETRAHVTQKAQKMMRDHNITPAVDLSRDTPLFTSDAIYTRLFGKGNHNIYQFSDDELKQIDHKILLAKAKTVSMAYHGVRMYTDAIRFAHYKTTGKFLSVTGVTGLASARTVLAEDTCFPVRKQELVKKQGWIVFDASAEEHIHLTDWLQLLPEKTYGSLDEVVSALEATRQ